MLTTSYSIDFMVEKIDVLYHNASLEDFETILCDTTPGTDSIVDSPSSIPPPKRRRRLDRLNGTTNSTTSSTTNQSDFSSLNNNNNTSTSNNNNQLKHERLSPGTPDTSSRSLTPSSVSHPDTPPAQDIMGGLGGVMGSNSPLLARNYSDIMRSLAAKYNNANPNEYFSRNGFTSQPSDRYKSHVPSSIPYTTTHLPPSTSNSNSSTDLNATPSPKILIKQSQVNTSNNSGPSIPPSGTPTGEYSPLLNPFTAAAAASGMFPPLIDMSSTQALMALVRTAKEAEMQNLMKTVKPRTDSPLDLSAAGAGGSSSSPNNGKKPKIVKATSTPTIPIGMPGFPSSSTSIPFPTSSTTSRPSSSSPPAKRPESASTPRAPPQHQSQEDITTWSVDDVCKFVAGIDICAEYEQNFREQSIDGSGLPLLTEEHLVTTMRMRLGPALKLRSLLAKKIGSCTVCLHCNHCHSSTVAHGGTATTVSASADNNRLTSTTTANSIISGFHQIDGRMNLSLAGTTTVNRRDSSASGGCGEGSSEGEGKDRNSPINEF